MIEFLSFEQLVLRNFHWVELHNSCHDRLTDFSSDWLLGWNGWQPETSSEHRNYVKWPKADWYGVFRYILEKPCFV